MATKTGQRGRPTKPAKEGEKTTLSLRVTPEMKSRLEEAGIAAGRNLSQEAEMRLEWSFRQQDLLNDTLNLTYGRPLSGLVQTIGRVMQHAGTAAAFMATKSLNGAADWLNNSYGFEQAVQAVATVLEAARPERCLAPPDAKTTGRPKVTQLSVDASKRLGEEAAVALLRDIASMTMTDGFEDWVASVRENLGTHIVERIRATCQRCSGSFGQAPG
jgi:hypothetical protein